MPKWRKETHRSLSDSDLEDQLFELLTIREAARARKDFPEADRIRDFLETEWNFDICDKSKTWRGNDRDGSFSHIIAGTFILETVKFKFTIMETNSFLETN